MGSELTGEQRAILVLISLCIVILFLILSEPDVYIATRIDIAKINTTIKFTIK